MRHKSYEVWSGLREEYLCKSVDPRNAHEAHVYTLHTYTGNCIATAISNRLEIVYSKIGHPCCGGWGRLLPDSVVDKLNESISWDRKFIRDSVTVELTTKQVRKIAPDIIDSDELLWWEEL